MKDPFFHSSESFSRRRKPYRNSLNPSEKYLLKNYDVDILRTSVRHHAFFPSFPPILTRHLQQGKKKKKKSSARRQGRCELYGR
ncbi:hypothetical protein CDAR_518841 [Caerostris darwini]|uniref:Ribosomal protein S18 n=1 Tax=Caerostris darwini TaxID=1538125 RepID=A0AAV4PPT6_9ARAC|nr:hypothetical protein CDAR_518841 [Caerostris darwini]